MIDFTGRLCSAIAHFEGGDRTTRTLIGRAIADTLAVAAAGFSETVTRRTLGLYAGKGPRTWSGDSCESAEATVLVNAVAAHALDFDDVYLDSAVHPSAVILPAIFAFDADVGESELIAAFGAGLLASRAIGRLVGQGHYHKGWHGTGTFGAMSAAAAVGRLLRLDEKRMRSAFALAAAQSGGIKLNFGTMAKPLHAGFAAAAGYRAARLAEAGIDGASDIFGAPKGYADLYGVGDGTREFSDDDFAVRPDRLSLKLYPCCYAAHRLIGIGLDARRHLGADTLRDATAVLEVPAGSVDLLRNDRPATGLEAKFSAAYTLALALFHGKAGLREFADDAVRRPGLAALPGRVRVVDDPSQQSAGDIEMGEVRLRVFDRAGTTLGTFVRSTIPGSPDAPPEPAELRAKLDDCFAIFAQERNHLFPALARLATAASVTQWTGEPVQ